MVQISEDGGDLDPMSLSWCAENGLCVEITTVRGSPKMLFIPVNLYDQVETFQVGAVPGTYNYEIALQLIHKISTFKTPYFYLIFG